MNIKSSRQTTLTNHLSVDMPYEGDTASITVTTSKEEGSYPTTGLTLDRELYRDDDISTLVRAIFESASLHADENPTILKELQKIGRDYQPVEVPEEAPQVIHGASGRLEESNEGETGVTYVAIGLLQTTDNHVVIVENKKDVVWEFPGGKLKKGESLEDALNREIYEEIGLDINKHKKGSMRLTKLNKVSTQLTGKVGLRFVLVNLNLTAAQLATMYKLNVKELLDIKILARENLLDYRDLIRLSNEDALDFLVKSI